MTATTQLLERIGALLQQSLREEAARHGLLPIHGQVLRYLSRANDYSNLPAAIADYFGITRGTVSQTVAVLERKGMIVKRTGTRNRRRVHLELTERGRAVLEEGWADRLERAPAAAGIEEPALERTLRALLGALQADNGQRPFGVCRGCAHFIVEGENARCGLTGEPLAEAQTSGICREWTPPQIRAA
ncbi:MAG: MarR family winged helix-turn-helix transcriptional regulator [Gammaproteobacteria bacterium]|nr:MarR family winged helix-turn-helix transcriptional regulator [Gammaproteobacteria bacterium]